MSISAPPEYEVGARLGGHTVTRKEDLDHLQGHYYELAHEKTGARHIHIGVPDDNNTFVVLFPTVPRDSTGVAHILEHVVLAGSQRFPVRDPFFSMIPRSLKTFMNALTSSDTTAYPFSTRNTKDFFNLLSVYLDATLFPLITEEAFKQEGHRFEFEAPDDPASPLRYKGVVFNEMKAQVSTAPYTVHRAIGRGVFPDLTYANNSGGDPAVMPDLTWEQLREFHRVHYHPSNAFFFTYGNLPLTEILERIEDEALSRFDALEVDVSIPDQKRFDSPQQLEDAYPVSKDEDPSKKSQGLVAWATEHVGKPFEITALKVLEEYLLGNPASPLRKALIESGLGEALSDGTGFHSRYREAVFAAGLKGIAAEDAGKVEETVLSTLERIVKEGADEDDVEAAIHQFEIDQKEVSNAGFPYSLKVFFTLAGAYIHGGDPHRSLRFDDDIERLRTERSSGPFFENLIRQYLLDNPHRVRILVRPDQELEEAREHAEQEKLSGIASGLAEEEKQRIVEQALELKRSQETKQDVSVLPTLELSDVPMVFEEVPHTIEDASGARVGLFPQTTNGITYVDIRTSFEGLRDDLKDLMRLFAYAVPKMGAAGDDYVAMSRRIASATGGIGAGASVRQRAGEDVFLESFTLSGKALIRNHADFLAIKRDLLSALEFDPRRLKEVLVELKAQMEAFVIQAGMRYAMSLAGAKLSPAAAMDERLGGLGQLSLLKSLASQDDLGGLIEKLEEIKGFLFRNTGLHVCVTSEDQELSGVAGLVGDALGGLPSEAASLSDAVEPPLELRHEAKTTAVPVAYNAKVFKTPTYTHPDAPALFALGYFLRSTYLHREVREKGGAYGANATFDVSEGLFNLWSYRDPNIVRTFQVFEDAIKEVIKGDIEADDLKEAILSACGAIDPLESPDTKGRRRFFDDLAGYTLGLREEFKGRLLKLTDEDFRRVAESYLSGDGASLATISSPEKVEAANSQMGGVFEVSPL